MTSNLHPDIAHLISSVLRMPSAKVQPCDQCGVAPCDHYPCENIQDPMVPEDEYGDPRDMRLEALP